MVTSTHLLSTPGHPNAQRQKSSETTEKCEMFPLGLCGELTSMTICKCKRNLPRLAFASSWNPREITEIRENLTLPFHTEPLDANAPTGTPSALYACAIFLRLCLCNTQHRYLADPRELGVIRAVSAAARLMGIVGKHTGRRTICVKSRDCVRRVHTGCAVRCDACTNQQFK